MGLFSFLNKGSKDAILTDGKRDTLISVLSTVERATSRNYSEIKKIAAEQSKIPADMKKTCAAALGEYFTRTMMSGRAPTADFMKLKNKLGKG